MFDVSVCVFICVRICVFVCNGKNTNILKIPKMFEWEGNISTSLKPKVYINFINFQTECWLFALCVHCSKQTRQERKHTHNKQTENDCFACVVYANRIIIKYIICGTKQVKKEDKNFRIHHNPIYNKL